VSSSLPAHLPILEAKLAREGCPESYLEREIAEPVALCDARGRLNPGAVGWSRRPLVRANLRGHWPRKKRWNFWSWMSPDFVFSVVVADIDFASFCSFFFVDFETQQRTGGMDLRRPGFTRMPEEVERSIAWQSPKTRYRAQNDGGDIEVSFRGGEREGTAVDAEFVVHKPGDHESLNVVVPWSDRRFQQNSKHNTLRCEGFVRVGDRRYELRPEQCHAVQDWGRGIWPHRSFWNWGVCTGESQGELVGVNMGARWTTGTGSNENGILYRGRLHKVMEDLEWSYDTADWMKPWHVRTCASDAIDLALRPFYAHTQDLNLGLLASGGTCAFGLWSGVVRVEGREVAIHDQPGWAEEFAHRW
jgi:hypothetical protein